MGGEPVSACQLFAGSCNRNGYGQLRHEGRTVYAHRLAFERARGAIPDGMCVCHKCDVRACINPEHLFLGTKGENNKDRDDKGRGNRGARNGAAKLNEEQVIAIRAAEGSYESIGRSFGISRHHASLIKRRIRWAHVEGEPS